MKGIQEGERGRNGGRGRKEGDWSHEGVKGLGVDNLLKEIEGLLRDGEGPPLVVQIDCSSPRWSLWSLLLLLFCMCVCVCVCVVCVCVCVCTRVRATGP